MSDLLRALKSRRQVYENWFSLYLRNAGSAEASVDGSVTPVEFSFTPARACQVHRMLVTIQDGGLFAPDDYGNIAGGLTNGVDFEATGGDATLDLLDGIPAKTNLDWAEICFDADPKTFAGNNPTSQVVRWTFAKAGIPLYLAAGESLTARINDDLTALSRHRFLIQGYYD